MKKLLKKIFCKHKWEGWDNLPGCQTFKCKKCGKMIAYDPINGFYNWN